MNMLMYSSYVVKEIFVLFYNSNSLPAESAQQCDDSLVQYGLRSVNTEEQRIASFVRQTR